MDNVFLTHSLTGVVGFIPAKVDVDASEKVAELVKVGVASGLIPADREVVFRTCKDGTLHQLLVRSTGVIKPEDGEAELAGLAIAEDLP